MATHSVIQSIIQKMESIAEEDRIDMIRRFVPTEMDIMGVQMPKLRKIAREEFKQLKTLNVDEIWQACQYLNKQNVLELHQLVFEILERHKQARQSLNRSQLEELGAPMDNWVSVDCFAVMVAGSCWRDNQIDDQTILEWGNSSSRWWRRAAVVCTVPLNLKSRGGQGDLERTFLAVDQALQDRDDMVVKAVSWALRELSKREAKSVSEYIEKNSSIIAPRAYREVKKKLLTGKK